MTIENQTPEAACSLDRYPGPALAYTVEDGQACLGETNDAFAEAFGPVAAETPLPESLEQLGLELLDQPNGAFEAGSAELVLNREQQLPVRVSSAETSGNGASREFLLSVVPPAAGGPGYLLFADRSPQGRSDEVGVDSVASVVSHDLRNPLDVAKARLRAARETGEAEHFDYVADAHDRMERIIEDVLTLARGDELIDPSESVGLATVVETAWESVDTDGGTLTVAADLPTVVTDRDRARRLFENLFRNCIEHSDSQVTVVVDRLPDAVGVAVSDDGPGIPENDREAVFAPGYSTHEHGTGLGLAIVKRIADGHGWTVRATDGSEGGARIELSGMEPASTNN